MLRFNALFERRLRALWYGEPFFFTKRRCFRRHIDGISFKYSKLSNFLLLILRRAFVSFMPFPQQPKGNWCEQQL